MRTPIIFCFFALFFITQAQAQGFYYLNWDSIDLTFFPAPPKEDSRADKKDLQAVIKIHEHRTETQCEQARASSPSSLDSFFGPPYGPLKESELRIIRPFMNMVYNDTDQYTFRLKGQWDRKRPYVKDPAIILCIPSHHSTSYPSGHSAIARSFAHVLSKLIPGKKSLFLKRADAIALDRIIGGVHHPKDVAAGKKLGKMVFHALMEKPEFRKELKMLKAELKKAQLESSITN